MTNHELVVRWTIGDVSLFGFEALRLSMHGAFRAFGDSARYTVCVNTVPADVARERVGALPMTAHFMAVDDLLPEWLEKYFDERMAEGVGWKFAPVVVDSERYELSLDNDCILWGIPQAIARWLEDSAPSFVLAEDVKPCFGRFADLCGSEPRNSGIRGIPNHFDLGRALRSVLDASPGGCTSELDEQGLQVASLERSGPVHVVRTAEVTICSPFWPHEPKLGSHGAHFVGLNARALPFHHYDRPASEWVHENWERLYPALLDRCQAPPREV